MKITSSVLVCTSVLSVLLASSGAHAAETKREKQGLARFLKKLGPNADVLKEDEGYWNRLMQESMSVPPPPPTPLGPTPPAPTPADGECLVEVSYSLL